MKKRFLAELSYTIDGQHPDIDCVPGWTPEKVFTDKDVYTFTPDSIFYDFPDEEIHDYIKLDMKLVAGGGDSFEHIHNVVFTCTRA